jgi:DNA primase small subunit
MPHSVSPTGVVQPDDEMPDAPPAETSTENSGVKLVDMFDDDDDDEFPASSAPDVNMKEE